MCANMQPGSRCPLDGEMLCRNERPAAAGEQAVTCTAAPQPTPQAQPIAWEPMRTARTAAAVPAPQH